MLTVDARCFCQRCEGDGRPNIYRMIGHCFNCGQKPILILNREGDRAGKLTCPTCGVWNAVYQDRLATPDEIPAA